MTKKVEVNLKFLLALTKSHDDLKHRVEHLESHMEDDPSELPVAPGFFFNATFRVSVLGGTPCSLNDLPRGPDDAAWAVAMRRSVTTRAQTEVLVPFW